MSSFPSADELHSLLNQQHSLHVLRLLSAEDTPAALMPFKAEALIDLHQPDTAKACLEAVIGELDGDMRVYGEVMQAYLWMGEGEIDRGIVQAKACAQRATSTHYKTMALGCVARGYARKGCPELAKRTIQQAIELDPNDFDTLNMQGRVALICDQRIEARAIYERMLPQFPAFASYELAAIAFLLGEFDEAERRLNEAISHSSEYLRPWMLRIANAFRTRNIEQFEACIAAIEQFYPDFPDLEHMSSDLERLRHWESAEQNQRVQLREFPSTMQRRDYCGPCTIELVMRFWKGGLDLTNDQIADAVKLPGSGTPIYRLREFFHLLGFETLRCRLSVEQIKRLIDAGFPIIIEQEFPNSRHVTVVIGYDQEANTLILQDPSSHIVTELEHEAFEKLRVSSRNGSIVAYPAGQGHDHTLALLDIYEDQALLWFDQACIALDEQQTDEAIALLEQILERYPQYQLAWQVYLNAEARRWSILYDVGNGAEGSLAARLSPSTEEREQATARFRALLATAQERLPNVALIRARIGHFAQIIGELDWSLAELQQAAEQEPDSAFIQALLAGTYFQRCEFEQAYASAERAVRNDPSDYFADAWMARCAAALQKYEAMHYAECAVERAPHWWLAQLSLGEAALLHNDTHKAQAALALAYSIYPTSWHTRIAHADQYLYHGEFSVAAQVLEQAQAHEQALTPYLRYLMYHDLAMLHVRADELETACTLLDQAIAANPNYSPLLRDRANWRTKLLAERHQRNETITQEELDAQVEYYAEYLALPNTTIWLLPAFLDLQSTVQDGEAALATIERLQERCPERGLHWLRAIQLSKLERHEEASQAILAALQHAEPLGEPFNIYQMVRVALLPETIDTVIEIVQTTPYHFYSQAQRALTLGVGLCDKELAPEQARKFLLEAHPHMPDNPMIAQRLAKLSEEPEEHERYAREALRLAPGWTYARSQLAELLLDQGRYQEVLELTSGYASTDINLLRCYAQALLFTGHADGACNAYEQLFQQTSWLSGADFYYKWSAEMRFGLTERAIATAQQARETYPDWETAYDMLSQAQSNHGDYEAAQATLDEARANGVPEHRYFEAQYELVWSRQDYEGALAVCDHILNYLATMEKPEDSTLDDEAFAEDIASKMHYWEVRRIRQLLELQRFDEARASIDKQERDETFYGDVAWEAQHADEDAFGLEMAERALALDPKSFKGLFVRASALHSLEGEETGIAAYHELRQAHPDEHNSYEKLAQLLIYEDKFDEALELAERAVLLGPFCHVAWATRGYIHMARGEDEQAKADFQRAWNRSDIEQRLEGMHEYWWMWKLLTGDLEAAEHHRQQAYAEAKTDRQRRHIAHAESLAAARAAA